MSCERIDVLVLSGDLSQGAEEKELDAVRRFLKRLSREYPLRPEQLVVVPGNHDLSWQLARKAYSLHRREEYSGPLATGAYLSHGTDIVEVRESSKHAERFKPFAELYRDIKGVSYPSEASEQFELQDFPDLGLLFLGFNSAWDIDHHFPGRAGIHPGALAEALHRVRNNSDLEGRFKLAVWHHPATGSGDACINDSGVLEQLAKAGFSLVLHGHIHKAETSTFRYDQEPGGRRLEFVAAGTFGAPTI